MIIRVRKVSGEGFLSFREPFEFDVARWEGRTLQIVGDNRDEDRASSNAAGKSALLEAVVWGLYGELCRRPRYADEVIHKGAKNCRVDVEISDDFTDIHIAREKARGKTPTLSMHIDDPQEGSAEALAQSTYQTKQAELERMLGMNLAGFLSSVMFSQGGTFFPDLKPAERASLLVDLLDLERYTQAERRARDGVIRCQNEIRSLDETGTRLRLEMETLEGKSHKADIKAWETDRQRQVSAKIARMRQLKEERAELSKAHAEQTRAMNAEIAKLEKILKDRPALVKRLEAARKAHNDLATEVRVAEVEWISIQNDVNSLANDLQTWERRKAGDCPYCSQPITGELLARRIKELRGDLAKREEELNGKVLWMEDRKHRLKGELTKNLTTLTNALQDLDDAKVRLAQLKTELSSISLERAVKPLGDSLAGLSEDVRALKAQTNPYLKLEGDRVARLADLAVVVDQNNEALLDERHRQGGLGFWMDGFKKLRFREFDTAIDALQAGTDRMLEGYSSELRVTIQSQRELKAGGVRDEVHFEVEDALGRVSYEMYSGGQRQRVCLAVAMALAGMIKDRTGREFNLMVFDEPNSALDDAGKDCNFDLFSELASSRGKAVLVTDHDAYFTDRFDHSVTVVKEGGCSRLSA